MATSNQKPPNAPTGGPQAAAPGARAAAPAASGFPAFPESAYFGVAAKFAELYSQHYEPPKEFLYMDFLALLGVILSGRWRVNFGELDTQSRLYLLKVAKSAWRRKSASTRFARKFIGEAVRAILLMRPNDPEWFKYIAGAGSAEGLANCFWHDTGRTDSQGNPIFEGNRRILLSFDEFRRFEKKAKGEGSVLLSAVNELFELNEYSNVTKLSSLEILDGHLGFLANTTDETFRQLVDASELKDIGFLNRLFLVGADDTRKRRPMPVAPPKEQRDAIRKELTDLLTSLPGFANDGSVVEEVVIDLTPEAKRMWEAWYYELPETDTTARLDALGPRLMGLLAFVAGKREVDVEIMQGVLDLLAYQWRVREIYRPLEGNNPQARLEEKIVQQLRQRKELTRRELRQYTNANRDGGGLLDKAITCLQNDGRIRRIPGRKTLTFCLTDEEESAVI